MALVVEHLCVSHGRTPALFDVSLTVDVGAPCCVLGRNGVGKTTLLNTIMGVLRPASGRILLDGRDITNAPPHERARAGLGYVPQDRVGFPRLTVEESLRVVMPPDSGRRELDDVLEIFPALTGLLGKPAGFLSGGQMQQLAIARALLTRPRMLILDEPTEGIQPSVVAEIEETIVRLHKRDGLGIVIAEQYVELALRLAERYVVLDAGAVVGAGATAYLGLEAAHQLLAI
ncbi:MAG: ATP-binding cassette domain-containing protein [Solirubrobacteraceae bacterium]